MNGPVSGKNVENKRIVSGHEKMEFFRVGGSPVPREVVFRGQKVKQVKHNSFDIYGPFRNGSPDERRAHEENNLFSVPLSLGSQWSLAAHRTKGNNREKLGKHRIEWQIHSAHRNVAGIFRNFWRLKFCLLGLAQSFGTWGRRGGSVLSNCEFADFLLNFKDRILGVLIESLG
jgi:hypothetical protein